MVVTTGGGGVTGLVIVALFGGAFLIPKNSLLDNLLCNEVHVFLEEPTTPCGDKRCYTWHEKNYHIYRSASRHIDSHH